MSKRTATHPGRRQCTSCGAPLLSARLIHRRSIPVIDVFDRQARTRVSNTLAAEHNGSLGARGTRVRDVKRQVLGLGDLRQNLDIVRARSGLSAKEVATLLGLAAVGLADPVFAARLRRDIERRKAALRNLAKRLRSVEHQVDVLPGGFSV